jgi:hypothetical protein
MKKQPRFFEIDPLLLKLEWRYWRRVELVFRIGKCTLVPTWITFSQQLLIHWATSQLFSSTTPGRTAGAIWVIVPETKVIFIGDAVTLNYPPFLANADLPTWLTTLKTLNAPEYKRLFFNQWPRRMFSHLNRANQKQTRFYSRYFRQVEWVDWIQGFNPMQQINSSNQSYPNYNTRQNAKSNHENGWNGDFTSITHAFSIFRVKEKINVTQAAQYQPIFEVTRGNICRIHPWWLTGCRQQNRRVNRSYGNPMP